MCLCVSACVCVMCIYIHVGTCVILINLDNYLYFAWKEHVYGKEQYFVFLIASLTKNQMWIKWILSLSLPVVNFQYKRTMQHWEQEYPIDRICWCTMGKMLYLFLKNSFLGICWCTRGKMLYLFLKNTFLERHLSSFHSVAL